MKDTTPTTPMFRTVGYTGGTEISGGTETEKIHDEVGQFLKECGGKEMVVAKTQGLQSTKAEIDIIRTLKEKDLEILYLVPIKVLGVKKIQRFQFGFGQIVPLVDLKFETGQRLIPLEFHMQDQSADAWGEEDVASETIFYESSDMAYKGISGDTTLTGVIPTGYKVTAIRCVAKNMEAGDKIRIGTTAGGQEVVQDTDISAGGVFNLTLQSEPTSTATLYVADDGSTTTPWAANQDVDLYFILAAV